MSNVINLNRENDIPNDLIRLKTACEKYDIKYATLYKYTRQLSEIPYYNKGGIRVSERDVRNWLSQGLVPARG